jgi:hypothetical protein
MSPWLAFALGLVAGLVGWDVLAAVVRRFQDWGRSHE